MPGGRHVFWGAGVGLCAVLAACSGPEPATAAAHGALPDGGAKPTAAAHDSARPAGSATDAVSATAYVAWQTAALVTPATVATAVPFAITAKGTTAGGVTAIQVHNGVGTWTRKGETLPLYVAYGTNFAGYDLGCGFALAEKRLVSVWLYCQGDKLTYVWQTDTVGQPLEVAAATGTCQVGSSPVPRNVTVPALALAPPHLAHGFRVHGPAIDLRDDATDATSGRVLVAGTWLPAFVYEIIDCGKCGAGGWIELHVVAYAAALQQTTVWIVYLFHAQPNHARLGWGVRLPDLALLPEVVLPAEWTATAPPVPQP